MLGFLAASTHPVTEFVVFSKTTLAIVFCSQVCRDGGRERSFATGLVETLARPGGNVTGQVAGKNLPPLTRNAWPESLTVEFCH
jgi:hypothetical protein